MRGKVGETGAMSVTPRITPAYAGKRNLNNVQRRKAQDHPRVCGEKYVVFDVIIDALGSPPRMRGKVARCLCKALCEGITPAYAGKSVTASALAALSWDHPRVCGEKTKKIP